jgi:hypothetical protein
MGDDGIDCEYGWQGRAQFLICLQDPEAGNHGLQLSEDSGKEEAEPLTFPTVSNVTLVGAWAEGSRSGYGLMVRRYCGVNLYNTAIQGWRLAGSVIGPDPGPITLDRCAFYDNDPSCTGSSELCAGIFEPPFQNLQSPDPILRDPLNLDEPDLRGIPSRLPAPLEPSEMDEWFDSAPYVGAVPPDGEGKDWTRAAWISWWRR